MSHQGNARTAVQAFVPDDEILDVALTRPTGFTKSQAMAMAVGGVARFGSKFQVGRHRGRRLRGRHDLPDFIRERRIPLVKVGRFVPLCRSDIDDYLPGRRIPAVRRRPVVGQLATKVVTLARSSA